MQYSQRQQLATIPIESFITILFLVHLVVIEFSVGFLRLVWGMASRGSG